MVKRKKSLKKGIISIKKQIEIHENKRERARDEGDLDLEKYYEKEIESLKKEKKRKKKLVERG
jgi:hypothetical protein